MPRTLSTFVSIFSLCSYWCFGKHLPFGWWDIFAQRDIQDERHQLNRAHPNTHTHARTNIRGYSRMHALTHSVCWNFRWIRAKTQYILQFWFHEMPHRQRWVIQFAIMRSAYMFRGNSVSRLERLQVQCVSPMISCAPFFCFGNHNKSTNVSIHSKTHRHTYHSNFDLGKQKCVCHGKRRDFVRISFDFLFFVTRFNSQDDFLRHFFGWHSNESTKIRWVNIIIPPFRSRNDNKVETGTQKKKEIEEHPVQTINNDLLRFDTTFPVLTFERVSLVCEMGMLKIERYVICLKIECAHDSKKKQTSYMTNGSCVMNRSSWMGLCNSVLSANWRVMAQRYEKCPRACTACVPPNVSHQTMVKSINAKDGTWKRQEVLGSQF